MIRKILIILSLIAAGWLYYLHSFAGQYRVYAMSWGHSTDYKKLHFTPGVSPDELTEFEWIFWLVWGKSRKILVDTGTSNPTMIQKWAIKEFSSPPQLLGRFKIQPSEISDIILTHAHWDHVGNLALFPRATVWIQKKEYEHLRSLFETRPVKSLRQGYLLRDYQALQRVQREGRLRVVDGDQEIFPGIRVHWIGGHTPGLQSVEIRTSGDPVLLMSDSAYFYENFEKISQVKSDFGKSPLKIPGHDPELFQRFFDKPAPSIAELSREKERLRISSRFVFNETQVALPVKRMREEKRDIHLFFVGDVSLARALQSELKKKDSAKAFLPAKALFELADLRFGNLECVFSNQPPHKRPRHDYYLIADPPSVSFLKQMGFDLFSLANNHSLDAGEKGLRDTMRILAEQGIKTVGVPVEQPPQRKTQDPVSVDIKGLRMAFLAYNDIRVSDTKNFPLKPYPADPEPMRKEITEARKNHDFVVVSFHWGREYDHLATERQKELARVAQQAGADLVVGHHPHVLQEISWKSDTQQLIAYSLGNFIFDLFESSRLRKIRRSMILYVRVDPKTRKITEFFPIPVYVNASFEPIPILGVRGLESLITIHPSNLSEKGFSFRQNLHQAKVWADTPQQSLPYGNWREDVMSFSFFNNLFPGETVLHERWQQGTDVKRSVGLGGEFSHGEFRKVIWLAAPKEEVLRIEYPVVKMGRRLHGFFGFTDWATMEPGGSLVTVRIFAGERLLDSIKLVNQPGWTEFQLDTSQLENQTLPIRFEFASADANRRYVGFNAWVGES